MNIDTEPLDDLHRECIEARKWVRNEVAAIRRRLGLQPLKEKS
jgi:hypothetical protein